MKEFFLILFFGKSILLTPIPIDIYNQWLVLKLKPSLEAITSGASIEVRFPRQHQLFIRFKNSNTINEYEIANRALPKETINVELVDKNGNIILLSDRVLSFSKDYIVYRVVGKTPFPTNFKFNQLRIKSSIKIKGIEIFWRNYTL